MYRLNGHCWKYQQNFVILEEIVMLNKYNFASYSKFIRFFFIAYFYLIYMLICIVLACHLIVCKVFGEIEWIMDGLLYFCSVWKDFPELCPYWASWLSDSDQQVRRIYFWHLIYQLLSDIIAWESNQIHIKPVDLVTYLCLRFKSRLTEPLDIFKYRCKLSDVVTYPSTKTYSLLLFYPSNYKLYSHNFFFLSSLSTCPINYWHHISFPSHMPASIFNMNSLNLCLSSLAITNTVEMLGWIARCHKSHIIYGVLICIV